MTTIREYYRRVNDAWPAIVPPLSAHEAERAARRLYRFACGQTIEIPLQITSGRNRSYIRAGVLRVNPELGWREFVHDLSHTLHLRVTAPEWGKLRAKPHAKDHARFELRMIKEVLRRGWLDGKLREPERAPAPKPTRADASRLAHLRVLARIAAWEAKERRAQTALKKLRRSAAAFERAAWKRGDTVDWLSIAEESEAAGDFQHAAEAWYRCAEKCRDGDVRAYYNRREDSAREAARKNAEVAHG